MWKEWEYLIISAEDPTPLELLNEYGKEGWELVLAADGTTQGRVLIFKREKLNVNMI